MNTVLRQHGPDGVADRQAWLVGFMRALEDSDLSERERVACWRWAEAWSLCMAAEASERAPRYPYEWMQRHVRHPAFAGCR